MQRKTMSRNSRLHRYVNLISNFPSFSNKQKKLILKHANDDFVRFITEVCLNYKRLDVCSKTKKSLKKHEKTMKKMTCSKISLKKRHAIVQKGGFVPVSLHIFQQIILT